MFKSKLFSLIFVVFILIHIASCGQTGDLYLPEDAPEESSKQKSKDQSKN